MNRVVFKYPLEIGEQVLQLPRDSEILAVGVQGDRIVMWAIVAPPSDPTDRKNYENHRFLVASTGASSDWGQTEEGLPEWANWFMYLGTVQFGGFVAHVFNRAFDSEEDL